LFLPLLFFRRRTIRLFTVRLSTSSCNPASHPAGNFSRFFPVCDSRFPPH
jgi:hypothetical protein